MHTISHQLSDRVLSSCDDGRKCAGRPEPRRLSNRLYAEIRRELRDYFLISSDERRNGIARVGDLIPRTLRLRIPTPSRQDLLAMKRFRGKAVKLLN